MANLKASKKNVKRIAIQTSRNRAVKSKLKTLIKKVKAEVLANSKEGAKAAAIELVSAFDKAAKSKVIHANKAARQKAAMAKLIFAA